MLSIQAVFSAGCCDEEESAETIGRTWRECGYLCDPHTAVALHVAQEYKNSREGHTPLVVLSTASPYKFPAAVLEAVGGDLSGDEFEQMDRLAALSGVPIPAGLAGPEGAARPARGCNRRGRAARLCDATGTDTLNLIKSIAPGHTGKNSVPGVIF